MQQRLAHITLLVDDYEEAIQFYTQKLHFEVVQDTAIDEMKRWVLIAPQGNATCCLLLAKAANETQQEAVGNQTGGRIFLFLYTDNFERDYQNLLLHQIKIIRVPKVESYGQVVVFADLYGNLWDLIEPAKQ